MGSPLSPNAARCIRIQIFAGALLTDINPILRLGDVFAQPYCTCGRAGSIVFCPESEMKRMLIFATNPPSTGAAWRIT